MASVDALIEEVRVAIDMNEEDATLTGLGDEETLGLDALIRSKLEEGARVVESRAPRMLLDGGKVLDGTISFVEVHGKGCGRMVLPDDFLRLLTFKMSDWDRAVTDAIGEDDSRYLLQSSRHSGLRGTPQRPVVAIVSGVSGLELEFWSCKGGSRVTMERGRYLPIPRIVGGEIAICEKLHEAVVLYTGYLTLGALGERERASTLLSEAEGLLASGF